MTDLAAAVLALNSAQRRAFDVQGNCVVEAPPGSGKTRLLVTKMASDLQDLIERPRGAACITLTNAAAMEVHDRFDWLSSDNRSNLFIGTVHSFALTRIVRPFAALMNREELALATVCTSAEADALWARAMERAGLESEDQRLLHGTVRRFRGLLATPEQWAAGGRTLVAARDAYIEQMEIENTLDFARIVELAVEFVEGSHAVRQALRAMYATLYVDEYQDLAPGLDRIVRAMCFGTEAGLSTLFAVGDADQAIYGWTGTDSRLLREVAALPSVTTVALEVNYRCGFRIAQQSRRLFGAGSVPVTDREGGVIELLKIDGSIEGQAKAVAARVLEAVANGMPLHEATVLCRTNAIATEVASVLEHAGVPAWVRIVEDWESPLSIMIERFCACSAHGPEKSGFKFASLLTELRRMYPHLSTESVGQLVQKLRASSANDSALEFTRSLVSIISAGDEERTVERELSGFLDALESGPLEGLTVGDVGQRRITGGQVYVTTLSSSKGLEFDHVFILDLEDGRIPFFAAIDFPAELEEERNKFYVGITRARHNVTLLWSGYTVDGKGRRRQSDLSRFVRELLRE